MTPFDAKPFENTVGKGEIAHKEGRKHCWKRRYCSLPAISPLPTVFSTHLDNFLPFPLNMKLSSENTFSLEESKICRLVIG